MRYILLGLGSLLVLIGFIILVRDHHVLEGLPEQPGRMIVYAISAYGLILAGVISFSLGAVACDVCSTRAIRDRLIRQEKELVELRERQTTSEPPDEPTLRIDR